MVLWPSGLRRYVQVVFLIGVGSNPTGTSSLLLWVTVTAPMALFNVYFKNFFNKRIDWLSILFGLVSH